MFRVLISSLALILMGTPVPVKSANTPAAGASAAVSSPRQSSADGSAYDADAERDFLRLANEARAQAGLAPLQADPGMTQAARIHAAAMGEQQQLSHQLPGEPALGQRLAANCSLHLDHAGENVGFAGSVAQAHEGFMHSPPHRENLLNPAYNIAGIGVVWNGFVLYVTEDFGHSLPTDSVPEAEEAIAEIVARTRREAAMKPLQRIDNATAKTVACSMAQADSMNTPAPRDHAILRYTTMRPENVPDSAAQVIDDRRARGFAIGTCYARTPTYPSGAYWVTLILY
ncbi:MAG: CAP domain-containing protein [Terriglobales bacterium]